MNILFLTSYYPPNNKGGAEISTHILANQLAKLSYHVTVITSGHSSLTNHNPHVLALPLNLTAKPLFEKGHSLKIAHQILSAINELPRPDIIHAHDFRTALVLAHLKRLAPFKFASITTIRDYAPISGCTNFIMRDGSLPHSPWQDAFLSHRINEASFLRKPFRLWQYLYNLPFRQKSFSSLDGHIYISHAQKNLISQHLKLKQPPACVVYNPIDPLWLTKPSAKTQPGLVLYVGTVEKYKGVEVLIRAWQSVASAKPNTHLNIIGQGADKSKLEDLCARLSLKYRVTFLGPINHQLILPHYDKAEVIVAPHLWVEPFGRTVAEAMARKKIVVTSNTGGPSELIVDNQSGFLVSPNDQDALSKSLLTALSLPETQKRSIAQAARSFVQSNLNPEIVASQYLDFYKQVSGKTA